MQLTKSVTDDVPSSPPPGSPVLVPSTQKNELLYGTQMHSEHETPTIDAIRLLIGAVSLGFVAFRGASAMGLLRPSRPLSDRAGMLAGGVAGFTSFVSHAGGPPAAVYLLSRPLTKTEFQATTVLVFWLVNLLKFPPYAGLGIFTRQTLLADLLLAPPAFAGVWLGIWMHRRVSGRLFFALTYVFLTCAGLKLIWDALT